MVFELVDMSNLKTTWNDSTSSLTLFIRRVLCRMVPCQYSGWGGACKVGELRKMGAFRCSVDVALFSFPMLALRLLVSSLFCRVCILRVKGRWGVYS